MEAQSETSAPPTPRYVPSFGPAKNNDLEKYLQLIKEISSEVDKIIDKHSADDYLLEVPDFYFPSEIGAKGYHTQHTTTASQSMVTGTLLQQNKTPTLSQIRSRNKTPIEKITFHSRMSSITSTKKTTKKIDQQESDKFVRRLYDYKRKSQARVTSLKELQLQQELKESPGKPELLSSNTKQASMNSSGQIPHYKQPIYKRVEIEIKRKEEKLKKIKELQEEERRQRNQQLGIEDDDEIIRKKEEKNMKLKANFDISTFEDKYEREIKYLFNKQAKRQNEKLLRESGGHSFAPNTNKGKSAVKTICDISQSNDATSLTHSSSQKTTDKRVEDRLMERGVKSKIKQLEIQKMLVPSFQPKLNSVSLKIANQRGQTSRNSDLRTGSRDKLERELISSIKRDYKQFPLTLSKGGSFHKRPVKDATKILASYSTMQ